MEEPNKLELIDFLKKVTIFSSLNDEEIAEIIRHCQLTTRGANETLFKEGDKGNELFIIHKGRVAITIQLPDGRQHEITQFKTGDFFGDMSIFDQSPRSASCITKENSSFISLHGQVFFNLVQSRPEITIQIMYKMLNTTTQRLRDSDAFLSDMVRWGEDARKRAITDELTGCYNRRFLDEALEDYFIKIKNSKKSLCLIMMDLDYFRKINECYGLEMGDKSILEAVKVFKQVLRTQDIIARYGGDEFTIILPETTPEEGRELAETIRANVEKLTFFEALNGPFKRLTTSQGLAAFPQHAKDLAGLKAKADAALYQAKEAGRNRVICAGS
jgi:diguanylate cyclase (GGDEF)-like protein